MTAAALAPCPHGKPCLMHSIDPSGSSFSDTPSLPACLGFVLPAWVGGRPCRGGPAPGPAGDGERGAD